MKKIIILLIIMVALNLIPIITATTVGTIKIDNCITLYQICENCTYNNISTILYPNKSISVSNVNMSRDDTYYNYSYCDTGEIGEYIVNGYGDLDGVKTSWVYNFEVTGSGYEFNQSRSLFYLVSFGLLIFFFLLTIYSIPKLPQGNDTDDYGMLIGINKLKYLRPVLYMIAWGLLLGITFSASAIAKAYMGSEMFGNLFFVIYRVMFIITLPAVIISFIYIFVQMFRDGELKRMIERGIDIPSTI